MIEAQTPTHLERFRTSVARLLGLQFAENRLESLADALDRLAPGTSAEPYLQRLDGATTSPDDVRALARELTVGETYFFRNVDQIHAFAEVVLPERMAANASSRKLRILSAGCASGEEAYTLAILVRQRVDPSWDVTILGVDVNPAAIERATLGRYSTWSLRDTPANVQVRWFSKVGREFAIDESIRKSVRFEERNLAASRGAIAAAGTYDVVFCRNVLMYFLPEVAQEVVAGLRRTLVPAGYLFLGHAENMRGLSQGFHLCHTHDTFYYQRRDPGASDAEPASSEMAMAASLPSPREREAPGSDWAADWVDGVNRSTARIQELSERSAAPASGSAPWPAAPSVSAVSERARHVNRALALLERERFGEALDLLADLPHEPAPDADVLLLRAALLTHSGQLAAAEAVCHELRGLDEMSAGAHYLLALCREGAGDSTGAVDQHQVAAYLDPAFAMPRLHLGLLARRAGDMRAAQRELREALALLVREDASRVLLFGGGFTREALTQLCRAELRAAGGGP
ncbi:MAG TPA: CheR family methyltransferase [Polyangiaceae bacterium]